MPNARDLVRDFARDFSRGFVRESFLSAVRDGRLTSAATFTRNSAANELDSDGLLQTAAVDTPRTTYIGGNPYLWLDGAVTEISGRSHDLDNWAGSGTSATATQDAVGLDGESNTGFTVTDNSDSATQFILHQPSITSSASPYYLVTAVKKDDSPSVYPRIRLALGGGGTFVQQGSVLNVSDGGVTGSGGGNGSVVLDPIQFGDYWLFVQSLTDTDDGNTRCDMDVRPAHNTDGGGSTDAAAQGSTVFGYCGLFKDNFSLMPILTTGGTTATVAADVASLANSVISGLTEGTLYMEIWTPQLTSNAARHIAELESDANNFIRVSHAADGDLDAQITDGGVSQAALAGTDLTVGTLQKVALTFKANEFSLYRDGTQLATDTSGTMPSVDTLLIGAGLYGGIKTMNVHTTAWSQAKAEAETT